VFRPGEDPLGNLAGALAHPDVLGIAHEELAATSQVLMDATLRRGPQGLVDAVRQAHLPKDHNLLVLVDQFEELFRFRRNRHIAHSRDEAIAFVRTLLEAVRQQDLPIYVALTMRSDFIGDCMDFPGLSEAVNSGLYLVGRMSRDALRSAITGPIAVGGGTIAPRLVHRVLNDLGDDQDQLPLVQHALMRTWEQWASTRTGDTPIDIDDYEAAGTFSGALSKHAEEAYAEAEAGGLGTITRRVFQALTDTVTDTRGVRRPTSVEELSAIAGVPESDIIRVVEAFRRPGRSFLMPPPAVPLTSRSIVDLSHESLMRCWQRLIGWAEEERSAAEFYMRLSRAARWHAEGSGGLWRNPELELAERWLMKNEPTAAWARRYDQGFDRARTFLTHSVDARRQEEARVERERRAKLRLARGAAAVLAVFLVVASTLAYVAWRESQRAGKNLDLARAAVDESLSSVDRDPARVGADLPQLEELRRELLQKAQTFYTAFMREEPASDALKRDVALAHVKIGHISRLLEKPIEAENEYKDAIARLRSLADAAPRKPELRASLADAYNWLGETLRPVPTRAADAEAAYDQALALQQQLTAEDPANAEVRRQFARSHYNRGILRADRGNTAVSEEDFREAIRLLEPLSSAGGAAAQELARAYNNLGTLLADDPKRSGDVRALWEKAIAIDERLVAAQPDNRDYKIELSTFCANLAPLLKEQGATAEADARSLQALTLVQDLARLPPSLTVTLADTHSLRGTILETRNEIDADREFGDALDLFAGAADERSVRRRADYHLRFGDLLLNLAAPPATPDRRALLARAVRAYAALAERITADGSREEAQASLETITRVLPSLSLNDRDVLAAASRQLSTKLGGSR
jgi:tetratricopeptide (TPR) repeat protein